VNSGSIQRAKAIEALFPAGVIAFEGRERASAEDLFPSEREYVARAVGSRVAEFAAGRLCARAAMAVLGLEPTPILAGTDRAPVWPAGIVGSITHTDDYCVAVVAAAKAFASLGVDAENAGRLEPHLWHMTLHPEERQGLESMEASAAKETATLLFSAKEAFYKCQYPLTRSWVGFEDVIVRVGEGTFEVRVINETRPAHTLQALWQGRFIADAARVVTGVALSA
jgi:4'-phosphopantetheinyl transferase EntD